jgi:hypothetical protein
MDSAKRSVGDLLQRHGIAVEGTNTHGINGEAGRSLLHVAEKVDIFDSTKLAPWQVTSLMGELCFALGLAVSAVEDLKIEVNYLKQRATDLESTIYAV